jgi:hypothetical protein
MVSRADIANHASNRFLLIVRQTGRSSLFVDTSTSTRFATRRPISRRGEPTVPPSWKRLVNTLEWISKRRGLASVSCFPARAFPESECSLRVRSKRTHRSMGWEGLGGHPARRQDNRQNDGEGLASCQSRRDIGHTEQSCPSISKPAGTGRAGGKPIGV